MYVCQVTGLVSRPGEKLNRVVVQSREKTYYRNIKNEETNLWEMVPVATGSEIVREINASEDGLALWESWSDEERQIFLQHL